MSTTADQSTALARLINHYIPCIENIEILLSNGFDVNHVVSSDSCCNSQWIGCTVLHLLAQKYHHWWRAPTYTRIIKLLSSKGANYLLKNSKGFTPLRLAYETHKTAAHLLNLKAIRMINEFLLCHLQHKNAANPRCNSGISHFHIACLAGNSKAVKFFLDKNVPISETINADSSIFPGCSGLHLAVLSENKDTVQLLLNRGADSTCLNSRGLTPLHMIIKKQIDDAPITVLKLRERKMRKNDCILAEMSRSTAADPNPFDSIGLSHLHAYCTRRYNFDLDNWTKLLAAGVDLNAAVYLDSPVWAGYTPAHFAARCNLDTMILLLENGADPFAKDVNGVTPIDLCLDRYQSADLSRIFDACSALRSIVLRNKSKLSDSFAAFETTEKLRDYLKSTDVGTATIPLDSPLWPGWTLLHLCVKLTQKEERLKIKACLEEGVPLIVKDENQMTALHVAYYMNKKNCVEELLKTHNTISANPVDKNGLSHFHIACIAKSGIVKKFLSKNVDPNLALQMDMRLYKDFLDWRYKDHLLIRAGSTPLHIAAITSNDVLVELLLRKNADPFQLDADGLTWFHKLLQPIRSCPDRWRFPPEILGSNPVASGGLTHVHVVCCFGTKEAVEALLPHTANINEPIGIESMRRLGECENATCLDTPLHLAARARSDHSTEIIELLLQNGADVGAKNADGLNPLHLALLGYKDRYGETKDVIKRLAVEYSEKKMFPDEIGLTKLHVACLIQDVSMIQESLRSGESANCRMKMESPLWPGEAPLYLLVKYGYPKEDDAVKIMLRHILQELEKAILGYQPLYALRKRQKKHLPESYDFIVNSEGLSALHISCMGSDLDIVENFIKLGVDFNVPKDFFAPVDAGFYPLHFAVKYGSDEVIELLLKHKINVDSQDTSGNAPIHTAALSNDDKLEIFARANEYNAGNKKNLFNKTVVELLIEEYSYFERNPTTEKNMMIVECFAGKFTGEVFKSIIDKISNVSDVDSNGRNLIHYITKVSHGNFNKLYRNIEFLVNIGYEVDFKDKKGKTALHHAALIGINEQILILLLAGADVNVIDNAGKIPLDYTFDKSRPLNYETNELLVYASQLKAAGLFINDSNKKHVKINESSYSKTLNRMKKIFITRSFTLRDVLSEDMVMRFPMMAKAQQQSIIDYLNFGNIFKEFKDWYVVLTNQLQKALKRRQLYEATFMSLQQFLDTRLPDHCLDSILTHLSNEDWKNITSATDKN